MLRRKPPLFQGIGLAWHVSRQKARPCIAQQARHAAPRHRESSSSGSSSSMYQVTARLVATGNFSYHNAMKLANGVSEGRARKSRGAVQCSLRSAACSCVAIILSGTCKPKSQRHVSDCKIRATDCLPPSVAKPVQQKRIRNQIVRV